MTAEPIHSYRRGDAPSLTPMNPAYIDLLSESQCRLLADVLRRGGVVWLMSDCAYALCADPRHPLGVRAVDALTGHAGHPIPVTVGTVRVAGMVVRFDDTVRTLTGAFWPGGLGIWTKSKNRLGRLLARRLHADGGVVARMSQSHIERQLSDALGMPITSAAMRENGVLVTDTEWAYEIALARHLERTPGLRTFFVRDVRSRVPLAAHSTMLAVVKNEVTTLRESESVPLDDIGKVLRSHHGVHWGEST
jgi:tRNA A37 threonylcarbamoyladenosine synthetase subunit TsaC/SUA5/YrdC